jgi:hypothetical protein
VDPGTVGGVIVGRAVSRAPGRVRRLARCAGLIGWFLAAAHAPAAPAATAATPAPPAAARPEAGPLQLSDVTLVQRDVRMSLQVSTRGQWTAQDLLGSPNRALCVALVHGDPAIPRGRICVAPNGQQTGLTYTPLAPDGTALTTRHLASTVTRPRPDLLTATFLPVAAGLPVGPYSWWAQAAWTDDAACRRTCTDRFPDDGAVSATVGLLGLPPCFGAAARDPVAPCENPELRRTVQPPLNEVNALSSAYCDSVERWQLLRVCGFAAPPEDAQATFALIGDSHAAGLRPAFQVVSLAKRWRGVSIVRSGCPATRARAPRLPTPGRSRQCLHWNRQVLTWLGTHPEIGTVFLSAHTGASVTPPAGQRMFDAVRTGYRDEIRTLLASGRRVVVIHDTPTSAHGHLHCIGAALRAGRPPGVACAKRRAVALRPDPLAAAAQALGSPQVQVIDLTPHICDERYCFALVGGAIVTRDVNHLTPAFSASLGPYILRALDEGP